MPTHEFTIHANVPTTHNVGGGNPAITNAETFGGTIPGIFDGTVPGSTLILDKDDTLIVRFINDLPHPTGIHWHGIELENYADGTELTQNEVAGAPLQTLGNGVAAGGTFLYKFNLPRPGIFWFHPHHHHATDSVVKGLYGIIIVKDADEITLETNGTLPNAANTHQLVLSDITVCKMVNDTVTYPPPVGGVPEWLSGATAQNGPSPADLCQLDPLNHDGTTGGTPFSAGQVPNTFRMTPPLVPGTPRTVEGQTVLTNGANVGGRGGTPLLPIGPAASPDPGYTAINAEPGQGIRFQIANTATTRYFRLILTTASGVKINLIRVGGESGILNSAVMDGGMLGTYNTKYDPGEILLPPASRADVVAVIPLGTNLTTCTMWTRDFQRTGGGWAKLPTVPVLHIDIGNSPVPLFTMVHGTALKSTLTPTPPLGPATTAVPFLNPGTFGKIGAPSATTPGQDIELTASGGGVNGINLVQGMFHPAAGMPYTSINNVGSTRYAKDGDILEFKVVNKTAAHHPFHLHGFSFYPVSLETNAGSLEHTWPNNETDYRDTFDVPGMHTVTFKVHVSDRPLADGLTLGGAFGRWFFHCHIFFHAHHGMISELVITNGTGDEKPNVNVNGSWAYAPKPGTTSRTGTFHHRDGKNVTLSAHLDTGVPIGTLTQVGTNTGTWSWDFDTETPTITPIGSYYVYITATDTIGLQDQAVFRLKVGAPDDGSDTGDPHIHTVDGKNYDFQAVGEFTLLKDSDGMEVQVRQRPVLTANPITDSYTGIKSCVSLNTAVAVRVGKHRISLQPGREQGSLLFFVDGKREKLTTQGFNLDGNLVTGFDVNGVMALRINYLHHPVLIVTPHFWTTHQMWYLNISISRTQANEGLMGPIPNDTWLPLLPTGASVGPMPSSVNQRYITLYKTFANAWRVSNKTSLFVYENGTSTKTFTDRDWPAGEPPCKLKPQFETPGIPIPQGMEIEKAKQICNVITDKGLHQDCVFDVATTGDEIFAEGYRIIQEIKQRGTAVQISNKKRGVLQVIVSSLIKLKQPVPKGTVTFYAGQEAMSEAIKLDENGRAEWEVDGLVKGTYNIKAIFDPLDKKANHPSSSPSLKYTLSTSRRRPVEDPPKKEEPVSQSRLKWVIILLILLLLALLIAWLG